MDEQSSKKLPWKLKRVTKPAQQIGDPPKPIPHNPCSDEQGPSVSHGVSLYFSFVRLFWGVFHTASAWLNLAFACFWRYISRTHRYPNRYQPILSWYLFDPRADYPQCGYNCICDKWPQIIPQCKLHAFALMFMSRTSKTLIIDRGPLLCQGRLFAPKHVTLSREMRLPLLASIPTMYSTYQWHRYSWYLI